MIRISKPTL